jgi:hypothetical protein
MIPFYYAALAAFHLSAPRLEAGAFAFPIFPFLPHFSPSPPRLSGKTQIKVVQIAPMSYIIF